MDVQLLRVYDKAQDINALYKEILRNCSDKTWYWCTTYKKWQCIDRLNIGCNRQDMMGEYVLCQTNEDKWILEKWINQP